MTERPIKKSMPAYSTGKISHNVTDDGAKSVTGKTTVPFVTGICGNLTALSVFALRREALFKLLFNSTK